MAMSNSRNLQQQLADLAANGDQHFDPFQFRFIESLLEKLPNYSPSAAESLALRAQQGLDDYRQRLANNPTAPQPLLQHKQTSALAEIIGELDARSSEPPLSEDELSFENLLDKRLSNSSAGPTLGKQFMDKSAPREMASVRRMRDTLARSGAQQRVRQAASNTPDDPGPLNPQKLAISSLALMDQLSPAYARRFVAYLDTLQWLDDAGAQLKS
jgi:hypothetical protein